MLTIEEAIAKIQSTVQPMTVVSITLNEARGLLLQNDALADCDSPPFDKSMMDGFAIRHTDIENGVNNLNVIETVVAGQVPKCKVEKATAIQIMTGAKIPEGTEAVVPIEQTEFDEAEMRVVINTTDIRPQQHIIRKGENTSTGDVVVESGRALEAAQLGALAEFGHANVDVFRRPRVAVLPTGDELVPVSEKPGPGKIRNSNESMLVAQIERAGAIPVPLGIAKDNPEKLRALIQKGLECDVLLLSGGVSAGKLDLVPSELDKAGVEQVFHKVKLKPGKPLWFGERPLTPQSPQVTVFGLPGNPVSSMVCFEIFVRMALRQMMGFENAMPTSMKATLKSDYHLRGDRPVFHPATCSWDSGNVEVELIRWKGSSDLRSTVDANCTVFFTPEKTDYPTGDQVEIYPWF